MIDVKDKIRKLLRLARGREDEPEGQTALALAQELMDEHGVTVEDDELDEEQGPDLSEWIVRADEPVPWIEMLLVSLCEILYGGIVMPMIGDAGWSLYVVCDKDEVDIATLTRHFEFLKNQIEQITGDFAELLLEEDKYDEKKVSSFALGVNFGITEILFEEILGFVPPDEHMPFAAGKALTAAPQPEESNALQQLEHDDSNDEPFDSFQRQLQASQEVFEQTHPPPDPPDDSPQEVIKIQPDWRYFEQGRLAAHAYVDEVFPPVDQEQAPGERSA